MGRTVTKLAFRVCSPTAQGSIGKNNTGMIITHIEFSNRKAGTVIDLTLCTASKFTSEILKITAVLCRALIDFACFGG